MAVQISSQTCIFQFRDIDDLVFGAMATKITYCICCDKLRWPEATRFDAIHV